MKPHSPHQRSLFALSAVFLLAGHSAQASTWAGTTANWSSNASPGWNGTGVPNAVGAIASFNTTGTTTQDITAGVTVGTIQLTNTAIGTGTRTITNSNSIILNNGGTGALIENSSSGVLSAGGGGTGFTLADSLTISNSGTNAATAGAISFSTGAGAGFHGSGSLTFSNVSNNVAGGQIQFNGASDFTGSVLIQKGAVVFTPTSAATLTSFGSASNVITLGSVGGGSATLEAAVNAGALPNTIVVTSGTGGTLVLGSVNTSASAINTFSGSIILNGNVSLTSSKAAGTSDVRYTGVISGAGGVTTTGTGLTRFGNSGVNPAGVTNTYQGNTLLSSTSSLTLSDNTKLTFYIGASGINNGISGTNNNTLTLDGDFTFNLTGAATTGSWNIVDIASLNETFSSTFSVDNFTENSNVWTMTQGATTYTFDEATGILTAVAPEPSTYAFLALGGVICLFSCRSNRRNDLASA